MFRPNTTADLNEFPALGTPPTMNRSAAPSNNRLASYASTAGNGFQQQQESLMDSMNDFSHKGNTLGSFPPIPPQGRFNNLTGTSELPPSSNNRNLAPRSFSMDEFPALRSSASPFDNAISRESGGKPEQWLDYANLREGQQGMLLINFFYFIHFLILFTLRRKTIFRKERLVRFMGNVFLWFLYFYL